MSEMIPCLLDGRYIQLATTENNLSERLKNIRIRHFAKRLRTGPR